MGKSIQANFFFNLIYTLSGVLFPLLTFPYASRIMGPEGIGVVNFQMSFVNYLTLFASLGIPMYATREIARIRSDKELLRTTVQELLLISFVMILLAYFIVGVLCWSVPQLQQHKDVFLILSLTVGFTSIGCEWFYQGVEDFQYIAIRGIVIRALSVVLLFVLVRTPNDLLYYAFYTAFAAVGNNLLNFYHLKSYGIFSSFEWSCIRPQRHLLSVFRIFLLSLITTIYLNLAQIILGLLKNEVAVGYFSAAQKIVNLVMMLLASLGNVMLPRLSNLIKEGRYKEFYDLAQRSADAMLMMSLPLSIGVFLLAPSLIYLFCGSSFTPSILVLQILAFSIIWIAFSNLFGIQMLYPLDKENIVIIATAIGVIINVILNFILIKEWSYVGTAITFLATEATVVILLLVLGRKYLHFKWKKKDTYSTLIATSVMGVVCWYISSSIKQLDIIIIPLIGVSLYIFILWRMKHTFVHDIYTRLRKRFLI